MTQEKIVPGKIAIPIFRFRTEFFSELLLVVVRWQVVAVVAVVVVVVVVDVFHGLPLQQLQLLPLPLRSIRQNLEFFLNFAS